MLVVALGAVVALPLTDADDSRGALAVGLALAVGIVELLIDAVPGIVLRLQTHLVSGFHDVRVPAPWAMPELADQQRAGAILWAAAEILDLPFLVLVFLAWIRADAREAAAVDRALDAVQPARAPRPDAAEGALPDTGEGLWWKDDPVLRERFREHGQS